MLFTHLLMVAPWILESDDRKMAGFMSLEGDKMEALFIAPEYLHQGLGTRLVDHAKRRREKLCVDVTEQNEGAVRFIEPVDSRLSADRRRIPKGDLSL